MRDSASGQGPPLRIIETSDGLALLGLAKAGHPASLEALLGRYSGLVRAISRRYFLPGGEFEDIVQEGMMGLLKAIRDFDPSVGASFYTFAALCIRRQLLTAVKTSTRLKHLPINQALSLERPLASDNPNRVFGDGISDGLIPGPEESLIHQEGLRDRWAFLQRELSPLEMTAAICYAQDMEYAEIADRLGISYKSVDNALVRVKRKCRKKYRG